MPLVIWTISSCGKEPAQVGKAYRDAFQLSPLGHILLNEDVPGVIVLASCLNNAWNVELSFTDLRKMLRILSQPHGIDRYIGVVTKPFKQIDRTGSCW